MAVKGLTSEPDQDWTDVANLLRYSQTEKQTRRLCEARPCIGVEVVEETSQMKGTMLRCTESSTRTLNSISNKEHDPIHSISCIGPKQGPFSWASQISA